MSGASAVAAANAQRGPRSALAIGHSTAIFRKRARNLAKSGFSTVDHVTSDKLLSCRLLQRTGFGKVTGHALHIEFAPTVICGPVTVFFHFDIALQFIDCVAGLQPFQYRGA